MARATKKSGLMEAMAEAAEEGAADWARRQVGEAPVAPRSFDDIPLFPQAQYEVDVMWPYLEKHLEGQIEDGLDLAPDFQRGHVWTEAQQIAYVEYILRGGEHGRTLVFNCPDWPTGTTDYVILDGLQRLTAVRKFMANDLPAFGRRRSEWTGHLRLHARFQVRVLALATRADVLRYYLDMNAGGTPHAASEIERVRGLLAKLREG